jgi:hypothetical protein
MILIFTVARLVRSRLRLIWLKYHHWGVNWTGPICRDPQCFRQGPHFCREYGCRWSDVAIERRDGTTTVLQSPIGRYEKTTF